MEGESVETAANPYTYWLVRIERPVDRFRIFDDSVMSVVRLVFFSGGTRDVR
jgi:hypothetical protein